MATLRICNNFGITPSKSYKAAGTDFYVPDIVTKEQVEFAKEAFKKSFKKTDKELADIEQKFLKYINTQIKDEYADNYYKNLYNMIHLYLSLDSTIMRASQNKVQTFIEYYLIWNDEGKPGINMKCNDAITINSGIKVALEHETAGIFFNKSGRGQKGFDVRACVVDEDYTGYVHLNVSFTKDNAMDGNVYCGEKLTQMVILPIVHISEIEELVPEYYDEIMKDSARGDGAFGSTDNIRNLTTTSAA